MGANRLALIRRSTKEPHSAPSSRKTSVKSVRKAQTLRVPAGKILKAQGMLIEGHSQREIARTLHMSGHSVAKVVRRADFQNFICEQQSRLFAIAPSALESFHAQVKVDGRLAYAFLKDIDIIPSRETLVTLMDPTPPEFQTGYNRVALGIANILIEGNKNFGIDIGNSEISKIIEEANQEEKTREKA